MTRALDVVLSACAIILLAPLLLPVAIALKCTGEHDVFYRQLRVGKGGRPFGVLKFATMLRNSASMPGGLLTQKDDPRILPLGGFLRKTKINELPQLLNVFVGQMSVIGPRPQAQAHYDLYSERVRAVISRLPPGLTGIGSLVFRDEESILNAVGDREAFYREVIAPYKGELEMWYAAHRGLWTYFALAFMTGWSLVSPRTQICYRVFKDLPPLPEELKCIM